MLTMLKRSLIPVLTKEVPVADPGVGARLLKVRCREVDDVNRCC